MIIDAVTESGRVYRIDFEAGLWSRISREGYWTSTSSIWSLKTGTDICWPWDSPELWEDASAPEIGKNLFISGKDVWYVSTPIAEILEVPYWNYGFDK